jgi:hypothetical protein
MAKRKGLAEIPEIPETLRRGDRAEYGWGSPVGLEEIDAGPPKLRRSEGG